MQQIYVLRSEDEKCTKIGRSYSPNSRCESITLVEGKKYYLLYESIKMENEEASKIENQIINHFKDYRIKGKEWLSVHPLEVIRFIHTIIKIPNDVNNPIYFGTNYKFNVWLDDNSSFKNGNFFTEEIRTGRKSYIAYIKLLHNCRFITIGFANIGDAKKFVSWNRPKIEVIKVATKLLYNLEFEEWKNNQLELKHKAEWRLI
jgi:hypothetical protein